MNIEQAVTDDRTDPSGPDREVTPAMFTTRPTLQGTFGMVSSTHWLASQSAMAVLERGGNAYDAAVAGAFVLHVVEPHLNGPAGEVPILLAPAASGPVPGTRSRPRAR